MWKFAFVSILLLIAFFGSPLMKIAAGISVFILNIADLMSRR